MRCVDRRGAQRPRRLRGAADRRAPRLGADGPRGAQGVRRLQRRDGSPRGDRRSARPRDALRADGRGGGLRHGRGDAGASPGDALRARVGPGPVAAHGPHAHRRPGGRGHRRGLPHAPDDRSRHALGQVDGCGRDPPARGRRSRSLRARPGPHPARAGGGARRSGGHRGRLLLGLRAVRRPRRGARRAARPARCARRRRARLRSQPLVVDDPARRALRPRPRMPARSRSSFPPSLPHEGDSAGARRARMRGCRCRLPASLPPSRSRRSS